MDCNCNHNIEVYSEPKIKHPQGNVFFLGVPLSKLIVSFREGVKDSETLPFESLKITVVFSKPSKSYTYNAEIIDGYVVVEDKGKLPVGVYDMTVLSKDTNGDPLRYKENSVIQIVDTTAEANYDGLETYDGYFKYLIPKFGGGRPSLIVITEDAVKVNEGTGFYGEITEEAVKLFARFGQSKMEVTENAVKIQIIN